MTRDIDDPPRIPLAIDVLRRARGDTRIGQTIHYFDTTDSTSSVAQQLAAGGAAEGTTVIAETQTKGRGRLGRSWVSPPFRNLYLSIILRPPIAVSIAPQLTLVVGLAVAEAVSEWTPRAAIKWPNDVLIDGRKVAGILTEMEADDERVRFVVVGIGVNLNCTPEDFPPELRDKVTGLSDAIDAPIDRAAFAQRLLARLEKRYGLFLRAGFAAIRPLWEGRSCLIGRHVQIDASGERQAGIVAGIADDGALVLRAPTGRESRVVVGDVTVVDGYAASDQQSALGTQPERSRG